MIRGPLFLAASGGVDSSVAALHLVEEGFQVELIHLILTDPPTPAAARALEGVRRLSREIALPLHVEDVHGAFEEAVLRPSWEEYRRGRTPNPCVLCNRRIKFGLLHRIALARGACGVATGHYARLEQGDGYVRLLRGRDRGKDQSYFLFSLTQEQRRRSHFPLGSLTKEAVRAQGRRHGWASASVESQDVCVAGSEGFATHLRRRFHGAETPGEVVDRAGRVLGHHGGIEGFTLGQRKGLGVALGTRAYVVEIDERRDRVVLSSDPDDLMATTVPVSSIQWSHPRFSVGGAAHVQLRHRHRAAPARIEPTPSGGIIRFDEPQRAPTPGQGAVFYRGDEVVGGGWIEEEPQGAR